MGIARKVAKLSGERSILGIFGGPTTEKGKQTVEFIKEFIPEGWDRLSAKHTLGKLWGARAVSKVPLLGKAFTPPDAYSKLEPGIDLKLVFHPEIMDRKRAQEFFNNLNLDSFLVSGVRDLSFKTRKTITPEHFKQFREIAAERNLDFSALRKVVVKDSNLMRKNGRDVDLNPFNTRKIAASKIMSTSENLAEKIDKALNKLPEDARKIVLKRFTFAKVKFSVAGFERLETLARKHGLDVYNDLGVKPKNIKTPMLDDQKLANRMIEAVRKGEPLDLKLVDVRKCDVTKAMKIALKTLSKNELRSLQIDADEMRGAKMTYEQKARFDKAFTLMGKPLLDEKTIAVSTPISVMAKNTAKAGKKAAMAKLAKADVAVGIISQGLEKLKKMTETSYTPELDPIYAAINGLATPSVAQAANPVAPQIATVVAQIDEIIVPARAAEKGASKKKASDIIIDLDDGEPPQVVMSRPVQNPVAPEAAFVRVAEIAEIPTTGSLERLNNQQLLEDLQEAKKIVGKSTERLTLERGGSLELAVRPAHRAQLLLEERPASMREAIEQSRGGEQSNTRAS